LPLQVDFLNQKLHESLIYKWQEWRQLWCYINFFFRNLWRLWRQFAYFCN